MKKKFRAVLLALMMITAFSTQTFAYSYYFHFELPYSTAWTKTPACYLASASPYVKPASDSYITIYYLIPKDVADSGHIEPSASNHIEKGTAGRYNFTYRAGFGGAGQKYYLASCPAIYDFDSAYAISGTWSP